MVTFDPDSVGTATALLSIITNDRFNPRFELSVRGLGV